MRRVAAFCTLAAVLAGGAGAVGARTASVASQQAGASDDDPAVTALRTGRYDDAITAWDRALRRGEASAAQVRGLIVALRASGQRQRALAVAETYGQDPRAAIEIANRHGEILLETGELDGARRRFEQAIDGGASDAFTAQLNLAILDFNTGRRAAAMGRFETFIDAYNRGAARSAEELTAVGVACTYLGVDEPALFHDAVRALDEAIAADPGDPEPRLRLGELFLAKYDSAEAAGLIEDVLRTNPNHARGLLAAARRLHFDGKPEAMTLVDQALTIDPDLADARAFRAWLLTAAESLAAGEAEAERALVSNPASLDALAMLAATRYIATDREGFDEAVNRALSINPANAELFRSVAELAVQNRLYADAVELAERGVKLDATSWATYGTLGINQLRIGLIDEGRANLERAFAGDPFNVWFKNTLDLLDTFVDYRTVETEHFDLVIRADRADLVALYMEPLAEDAYARLTDKYGFTPDTRIRVEVFDRHADFSVRTVGLAGLGALGVAFGPVVAVDAPAAPGLGEFNWGSTLWHEIAHVITLGATGNRIPRWLTEGLSVFEERRAREGWGEDANPGFLLAFLQGRLLPVSEINEGFVRPRYPRHVVDSYFQASLVCELIEQDHGFGAIREMLAAYRAGQDTPTIVEKVLGVRPDEFDARFEDYVRTRYAGPLAALQAAADGGPERGRSSLAEMQARADGDPDDFLAHMSTGAALASALRDEEAVPYLERAKRLFPGYAEEDSPYFHLAAIHQRRGQREPAIAELQTLISLNESAVAAYSALAGLLAEVGRSAEAAAVLTRVMYVDPWSPALHERTADLWEADGEWRAAVVERRAVVALDPVDRARAYFLLARAEQGAGDLRAARRAVLAALEIAPGYVEAQELLLALRQRDGT